MTVAIAIRANDGVVIATDSMASDVSIASLHQKVRSCSGGSVIWAFAGDVSLAQSVRNSLDTVAADHPDLDKLDGNQVTQLLAQRIRRAVNTALVGIRSDVNMSGLPTAEFLLAGMASDGPFVSTIQADLTAVLEDEQQMTAIGVGKVSASALRASLSHYLSESHTVGQALPIAYRVVDTVCDVSAYAIAPPVQIATVTASGAEVLTTNDLGPIQEQVQSWIALELGTLYPSDVTDDTGDIPRLEAD